MKSGIFKSILVAIFTMVLFMSASQEAMAQYTYSTVISGITYKLHFTEEKGTWTVQCYDSNSNKWVYGSILASEPDRGYWKMKDGAGKTWEVTTYDDNTCIIKDASGYTVKYWME